MSQYLYIFQITAISQAGREKRNSGDLVVADSKAEAKFIFYFYTSTIISTSTSYSKTYTLTLSDCTPSPGLFSHLLVPSACG